MKEKREQRKKKRKEKAKRIKGFRKLVSLLITGGSLLLLLIILNIIRKNERVAEVGTLYISRPIVFVMGHISSPLFFSLFEWLLICTIIVGIMVLVFIIRSFVKKHFLKALRALCIIMVVALSVLNVYVLSAGFAYYRAPIDIPMSETVYKDEKVLEIAEFFLNDFIYVSSKMETDENGNVLSPYTTSELSELMQEEFKRLDSDYFFQYTPRAKTLANSWFMSSTGYAGVSFLPLGEPSVNSLMPKSQLVHTMAHEIAHTKGVMRENEANLVALYILLTSENEYLRYCGYFDAYSDIYTFILLGTNFNDELAEKFHENCPSVYANDVNNAFRYWFEYKGPFDFLGTWVSKIGDTFNDWYLKINGADDGMGSYNDYWDYIPSDDIDPETEKPIIEPIYSNTHKMMFKLYENLNK